MKDGGTLSVVNHYSLLSEGSHEFMDDLSLLTRKAGLQEIRFDSISIFNDGEAVKGTIRTGSNVSIDLVLSSQQVNHSVDPAYSRIAIAFFNDSGASVVLSSEMLENVTVLTSKPIRYARFTLPKNPLTPGLYRVVLFLESLGVIQDWITEGVSIRVEAGDYYGSGRMCPVGYEGKAILVDYTLSLG